MRFNATNCISINLHKVQGIHTRISLVVQQTEQRNERSVRTIAMRVFSVKTETIRNKLWTRVPEKKSKMKANLNQAEEPYEVRRWDETLWQFLCYFMLCKRSIIVKTSKQIVNSRVEKRANKFSTISARLARTYCGCHRPQSAHCRRWTRCCSSSFYVYVSVRLRRLNDVRRSGRRSRDSGSGDDGHHLCTLHTTLLRRRDRYYYWRVNLWFRFNNIFTSLSCREAGEWSSLERGDSGVAGNAETRCHSAHMDGLTRLETKSHVPKQSSSPLECRVFPMRVWVFHRQHRPTRTHISSLLIFTIRYTASYVNKHSHIAYVLDSVIFIVIVFSYACSCTHSSPPPSLSVSLTHAFMCIIFGFAAESFIFISFFTTQGRAQRTLLLHTLAPTQTQGNCRFSCFISFRRIYLCFVSQSEQLNCVWKGVEGWNWFKLVLEICMCFNLVFSFFPLAWMLVAPRFVSMVECMVLHVSRLAIHLGDLKGI